jgi:sarcosine oxidase subunit alpha
MMLSNPNRLASGGCIDRTKPLAFRFNGRRFCGFEGDTLASALLANGVTLVGRSFKLHRPRGITGLGSEDTGGFVQIIDGARSTPNVRATQTELVEGLVARSVNCWPNARWDISGGLALLSRVLPAGFYYKTFKWPDWRWYEPLIRRLAGLGCAPQAADPDLYDREYLHCDVLVIGGGPAGIAAAGVAAASGADVIVAEERKLDVHADGHSVLVKPNMRVLDLTSAFGYYDDNLVAMTGRCGGNRIAECLYLVRAREVVLATGAIERPLIFPGNDRPGVMLASAVRGYLERYAVVPGRRVVLYTSNDDAYRTVVDLHHAQVRVAAVIDTRAMPGADAVRCAAVRDIPVYAGSSIVGTKGWHALRSITIACQGETRTTGIACDLLCVSGGWTPTLHLFSQSGGKLSYDERLGSFVPGDAMQRVRVVGAALGGAVLPPSPKPWSGDVAGWSERAQRSAFVDLMSDVSVRDIAIAAQEGYVSVEHLKRYTTLGMSPDQGKTSNVNGHALLSALTGRTQAALGTTKFRPPFNPVTLGTLAGRARGALYSKVRRLPTHGLQCANGALMEELSGWMRPAHYGEGSAQERANAEVLAVRERAGLMDYSPIGKFEVTGRDAARFLERMYAAPVTSLRIGSARYGLMLNDNGIVIDDGIVVRLSEQRFFITATSGHAEMIGDWLDEWAQCAWPELEVLITPLTTQFAALLVSGPRARTVLAALKFDFSLAAADFPHMTVREGMFGDIPVRVLRTGFSGETSFEIYVPWRQGSPVWELIVAAGAPYGLTPFGIDAMLMLRLEKGFIHVGVDTDSTTVPEDLNLHRLHRNKSESFIGMQALGRPQSNSAERFQLVGFEPLESGHTLTEGGQIPCRQGSGRQGAITSSGVSPTLKRSIAIGMLAGGRARHGEIVQIHHNGRRVCARVRAPCFFDPNNERLRDAG